RLYTIGQRKDVNDVPANSFSLIVVFVFVRKDHSRTTQSSERPGRSGAFQNLPTRDFLACHDLSSATNDPIAPCLSRQGRLASSKEADLYEYECRTGH